MSDRYYTLNGKKAVPCGDLMKWAEWFESADRIVAATEIDDTKVSTVFLGLDHSFGEGPPLLFETMVFGGDADGDCDRYTTWEEAEQGHAAKLAALKRAEPKP